MSVCVPGGGGGGRFGQCKNFFPTDKQGRQKRRYKKNSKSPHPLSKSPRVRPLVCYLRSSEARSYTNLDWATYGKCSKPGCFQILVSGFHLASLQNLSGA